MRVLASTCNTRLASRATRGLSSGVGINIFRLIHRSAHPKEELHVTLVGVRRRLRRTRGGFLGGFLVATLIPTLASADPPIASSSFVGAEDPLSENGAWAPLTSLAPQGTRFQKNNGAYPDRFVGPDHNHAGARTTAIIPPDHYSEIVVGHVGTNSDNVGPIVRVQTSGSAIDSHYLWWATQTNGNNALYRVDANGTSFTASPILTTSPVADGDRLRLIARGQVIYGIKNGVRDFIYNIGPDTTKYSTGTAGMLAFNSGPTLTDAMITSWSSGAAPGSSGTWASSTFAGIENPLDEGDRWYPLPTYSGFRKAGGLATGRDGGHNASGVWSIAPPARQYSEVTLGTVASGGGGPIVRIDRSNAGQTGWLLFLWADNPASSGIYKMTPGGFTAVRPFTPTIATGDKWRLTADGNTLEVFRNGVSQFMYATDGSYPSGDVGIEALTPAFTFIGWEGGDTAGGTGPPTITSFDPTSGPVGTSVTINGTNFTGATAVTFNTAGASFTVTSATAIQAPVPAGATTGPLSVTTPGGTATSANAFTVKVPLTATKAGTGSGTVTSSSSPPSPTQIDCGATCLAFYDSGTVVTLSARPNFLSVFDHWSDCDAVSGRTCTVTMSAARSVTANFTLQRFTLTVYKASILGIGNGTVTSNSIPASPTQINCGPTCSASYDYGTVVTLSARPNFLSVFDHWSDCDAVSGRTCTVTMSAARSVTANFLP